MPVYESIEYTPHALTRMKDRRITKADVELTLRLGEGRPARRDKWFFELGHIRVVVVEFEQSARVVTVIRLRGM